MVGGGVGNAYKDLWEVIRHSWAAHISFSEVDSSLFSSVRRKAVIAWQNWKGLRCSWLYHNRYSFQILKLQSSDVQNSFVFVMCLSKYDIMSSIWHQTARHFSNFLASRYAQMYSWPRILWNVLSLAELHPCAAEQCTPAVETKSLHMRALSCFHAWLCACFWGRCCR